MDGRYFGMIGDVPFSVQQRGAELRCRRVARNWRGAILRSIIRCRRSARAFQTIRRCRRRGRFCRGLRIVRQPAWECLATFITSALKQVAHIAQISHTLRERFGMRLEIEGRALFSYPYAGAHRGTRARRTCGPARWVFAQRISSAAARMIAAGEVDLSAIEQMDDAAARAELCRLPGVGEKVANCALLFGFERLRAFPVDVWIERVLRQIYFARKRKVTARRLREFSATYFGEYSGYAQQYLFHHARTGWVRAARAQAGGKPKTR